MAKGHTNQKEQIKHKKSHETYGKLYQKIKDTVYDTRRHFKETQIQKKVLNQVSEDRRRSSEAVVARSRAESEKTKERESETAEVRRQWEYQQMGARQPRSVAVEKYYCKENIKQLSK